MLTVHIILAAIGVAALALRSRSSLSALVVAGAAAVDIVLGAHAGLVLGVVAPLVAFLAAALSLAALVRRSGLAERAASVLAARARGNGYALYASVCGLCALLTTVISLDGAVVLMVPLLLSLARRWTVPFGTLFLGVVAVANAVSIAVPQGNPTNLVVIDRLGLSPATFVAHMFAPGLLAAILCATAVALAERRALTTRYEAPQRERVPLSPAERQAAGSLVAAALAAWIAPFVDLAPWWPFAGTVAIALAVRRRPVRLIIPWRIAAQVGGLLVLLQGVGLQAPARAQLGLLGLLAIAAGIAAASAVANNLPVSVWAGATLATGPGAYAASIGLAIGSLATPQGSVATLIATELAGPDAPPLRVSRFGPLALLAVIAATSLCWATL